MALYRVLITVKEVKGTCPIYKIGDILLLEGYYVKSEGSTNVCMHALAGMVSLLSAFSHRVSAKELGIGETDDEGYLKCPDLGPAYVKGGTIAFHLKRLGVLK